MRTIPRRAFAISARLAMALAAGGAPGGHAAEVRVTDRVALQRELDRAQPGTTLLLAPGDYGNSLVVKGLDGTKEKPIVISGLPDAALPRFSGGAQALHLSDCNYVVVRRLRVSGCTANGINADDGGTYDTPSRGMVFEGLLIEDVGPTGNRDGLKLSGLTGFTVRDCLISGWGGSAIDMVGCRDGVIEKSRFVGKQGFSQDTGVQAKGGSERVRIRGNVFNRAGQRAVNLGGSTGLDYFRPAPTPFEAREIVVEGNSFVGSLAPVAYVTSTGCRVSRNTIVHPEKWVLRILQEQPTDRFMPCQDGVFENNLIVFDRRVQVFANVGPNTRPGSFRFRGNAWFDVGGSRRPVLPVEETDGVYQVDPGFQDAEQPFPVPRGADPRLKGVGAHSFAP